MCASQRTSKALLTQVVVPSGMPPAEAAQLCPVNGTPLGQTSETTCASDTSASYATLAQTFQHFLFSKEQRRTLGFKSKKLPTDESNPLREKVKTVS